IVCLRGLLPILFFGFVLDLPVLGLRILGRLIFGLLVLGSCISLFGKILYANFLTVADAQHHDDVVGLLLCQRIARDVPPVEITFRVVLHQAGVMFVLANHANLRRIGEDIFEAIAQPVGHVVAHHHDRSRRPGLLVFSLRLFRRWCTRAFAWLLLRVLIWL